MQSSVSSLEGGYDIRIGELRGVWWEPASPIAGAVVLVPGFGGGIDVPLTRVAEHLTARRLAALAIDRPGCGGSGGEPRHEIDPERDVAALERAIAWLVARVTPAAVAIWGTSFGALEAAMVAARPGPVRGLVAQAPPAMPRRDPLIEQELERSAARDPTRTLPLVAERAGVPCAMPGNDAWRHLTRCAPVGWHNAVTIRSLLRCGRLDPEAIFAAVRVPALAIGVGGDPRALALERLPAPWRRVELSGSHFDLYGELLPVAATTAAAFFAEVLAR